MIGVGGGVPCIRVLRREPSLSLVHHGDERGWWATRGRELLFQEGPQAPWRRVARFPRRSPLEPLAALRPACRALRLDRCNLYPTRSGALLGIRAGTVYRIEGERFEPLARIRGDCVMNRAIAEDERGRVYFGEYFTNDDRLPVRIWRLEPGLRRAEVARELRGVRHVHAIHPDPFTPGRLWFTTGDFEGECFVGYTDDGFERVELLGDGGQRFRAVGLLFAPERLTWLTDSELELNRVVTLERATGATREHGLVATSAWYLARATDGVALATTTVEPGPSIRTRHASLLLSEDGLAWREALSFEKDAWPMPWFKFGSLSLPSGRFSSQAFWVSGEGLRGLDGGSWLLGLAEGAGRA